MMDGHSLVGACIGISVVEIVFVTVRFYTSLVLRRKIGFDDYLITFALLASLAKSSLYIYIVRAFQVGNPEEYMVQTTEQFDRLRKILMILQILDIPLSITPGKLAVLVFYTRIFALQNFRIVVYVVGSVVLAFGVAVFLETIFQCQPFAYIWNKTIADGTCISRLQAFRIFSPINALTGLVIVIMPIPDIWKLHTPIGQRLAVIGVFLLGGLGTVVSILRIPIFYTQTLIASDDPRMGFSISVGILVVVESGIIIVASCLMSIWPLFTQVMPRRLQASFSRHPRENQPQCWHLRDIRPNSKSTQQIARCTEVGTAAQISWNSSSSPCSLADLEDQRLTILHDDARTASFNGGRECHVNSTL